MITIGVELNHVVRNVNKQILKYYAKEFDPSIDVDGLDDSADVLEKYAKFNSKYERNNFLYVDYPFEIFGCAPTVEPRLATKITNWMAELTNVEDEEVRVVFFGLHEDALTIQSSFFFLSKIGCRARKVLFPNSIKEVWDECDVVVTTSNEFLEEERPEGKKVVLISREYNEKNRGKAELEYAGLGELIDDNNFLDKVR